MVEYHCILCSFTTIRKSHYERHLKTKKHLSKEKKIENEKNISDSQMTPNDSQMTTNDSLKTMHQCNFCNKFFSKNSNLHRHIKICKKNKKINSNDSQNDSIDSKNVNKMSTIVNNLSTICQQNVNTMSTINQQKEFNKNQCQYCLKIFTTRQGKSKHLQTCKIKKQKLENDMNNDMKKKIEALEKNITNNINNMTNINTQNNGTINYLNINFNKVQPMEKFIENFKTKFQLSDEDRRCLLNTYNECDIGLFSDTFFHMMKKYLIKQIDENLIPTIPMVCTDSNLRSIKEYHKDTGWKTTQSHKCIDEMIDISNRQIFETENTMMCFDQKQRNKIYSRMKQENSLLSMEEDKEKYEEKKNSSDQLIANKDKNEKKKVSEKINSKKEMDFSIINDELIEKYSLPNAPKLIT